MNKPKINFIHLCDYASLAFGGKLNVFGIFKNINTKTDEIILPQFFVVSQINVSEIGEYIIIIKIVKDSDGSEIPVTQKITFNITEIKSEISNEFGIIAQFNNTKFNLGTYKIKISYQQNGSDEEPLGDTSFTVSKI